MRSIFSIFTKSPSAPILPFVMQDVENMCNKDDQLGNKRQFSICFKVCMALVTILALVGIGVGAYFGITSYMTCPPVDTTSVSDGYSIEMDVPLPANRGEPTMRTILFRGKLSHIEMLKICKIIDKGSGPPLEWFGKAYLDETDEAAFDEIIQSNAYFIFDNIASDSQLMWTGCYFKYNSNTNEWEQNCKTTLSKLTEFNNFCNKTGWSQELTQLQTDQEKERIFIVKDYSSSNNGCWQLFTAKMLSTKLRQTHNYTPLLPFVCLSKV